MWLKGEDRMPSVRAGETPSTRIVMVVDGAAGGDYNAGAGFMARFLCFFESC